MTTQEPRYLAYLLRLWQASAAEPLWRASLDNPHTGERQTFTSIADLFVFLEEQMNTTKPALTQPPATDVKEN